MSEGIVGSVANRPRPRSPNEEDEEDSESNFLAELEEVAMGPLKEDLSEWLAKLLCIEITGGTFLEALENGVQVCRLAEILQNKLTEQVQKGFLKQTVPSTQMKYRSNAKPGTWFARDNAANFIRWCKDFGVKQESLFESEGLVMRRDPRAVVLCILELARLGATFGIEPPSIIKLEHEIEREESKTANPGACEQPVGTDNTPSPDTPRGKLRKKSGSSTGGSLDTEVERVVGDCNCNPKYIVNKTSEGKYNIGGKNMFVRLLKGCHVMVRVGGGWDTLEHYLVRHDPCKILTFRERGVGDARQYLHISSKYKLA